MHTRTLENTEWGGGGGGGGHVFNNLLSAGSGKPFNGTVPFLC